MSGLSVIRDPVSNRGLGFSGEERLRLKLRGLLPAAKLTLESQVQKEITYLRTLSTPLEKYRYLTDLQDRNETLFYRLVMNFTEELTPLLYTPTVGEACIKFSQIFRRARGLYLTFDDLGHVREVLDAWPHPVKVIVVTDGERILGLGDLDTAFAGIDPAGTLPVTLDVGTNNKELLADPTYIGTKAPRERGPKYDQLVEEFIRAAHDKWRCLIQFEDFGNSNAFRLLNRYRDQVCTFNDDIQGTASVVLAGLFGAVELTGTALDKHTFVFLGAGEAGTGIAQMIVAALVSQGHKAEDARKKCWFVDSRGLVVASRKKTLEHHKLEFAHEHEPIATFEEAVYKLKPTAIIGVSGQPKTFTKAIVKFMAQNNRFPIIFALSNPTSQSECTAAEAYKWTKGAAVFASGSPFDAFTYTSKATGTSVEKTPGQGNNAYIFPGVGLGVVATGATKVTDEMFLIAAKTLAGLVSEEQYHKGTVYPPLSSIRPVSLEIAVAIAENAYKTGVATVPRPKDLPSFISAHMYDPKYTVTASKL